MATDLSPKAKHLVTTAMDASFDAGMASGGGDEYPVRCQDAAEHEARLIEYVEALERSNETLRGAL